MPTMMPYPISGGSPVPEKMISETFRWITNSSVKECVLLHSFEVSGSRRIGFVLLDKTHLCVICLEVVSEPTDLVDPSGDRIKPISISKEAMEDLRKQFPAYFDDDSPLALGHAVVCPSRTQYEAVELPEHLKPIFPEAEVLPGRYILQTGFNVTCDPLDPNELGKTLADYALDLRKYDKTTDDNDWDNAQHKMSELRDEFEKKYSLGATSMKPSTIFSTNPNTLNRELLRLTLEQFKSLRLTETNSRCVIDGRAGTGKTVLAMELARRRAEEHGETVALMCSNANLSHRFEKWATGIPKDVKGKIVAGTPATLLLSVFENNDDLRNRYRNRLNQFPELEKTLRLGDIDNGWYNFVTEAINVLRDEKLSNYFDYLIVDEAQNLIHPLFLNLMKELLKNDMVDGHWTMFGDLKQAIVLLNRDLNWREELKEFGIDEKWAYDELITNCRNTHEIADAVSGLSRIESYSMSGVHGPDVQIKYFQGQDELEHQLDKLISTCKSEGLESRQIILLSSTPGTAFGTNQSNYGGWELRNINIRETLEVDQENIFEPDASDQKNASDALEPDVPPGILRYSDVYDFQGLESDLVILAISGTDDQVIIKGTVLLENENYLNKVLYIGMSRAKTRLIVLADKRYEMHLIKREEMWKKKKTRP